MLLKDIFSKKLTEAEDFENNNLPAPKTYTNKPKNNFEEFVRYLNMVNPETNQPYRIPYLSPLDPDYDNKYVKYMKMKERDEELFNKIMEWN